MVKNSKKKIENESDDKVTKKNIIDSWIVTIFMMLIAFRGVRGTG